MGWEALSEGTFLTPASVSKISSVINDVLFNWFEHIPEEIIPNILVRLPVKSLVICTSVCKSWRVIIKDPIFMLTHLNHTLKSNAQNATHLILLHTIFSKGIPVRAVNLNIGMFKEDTYTLHFDNLGFDQYHCNVEIPLGLREIMINVCYRVVGTCNGLVCLVDDLQTYGYTFVLWNPCVRKYVKLPKPFVRFSTHGEYEACVGMGYDARINDYKVVRLTSLLAHDRVSEGYLTLAQVYSLAKGSWGEVHSDLPSCLVNNSLGQVFVNGVVHWSAFRGKDDVISYIVLTFDVGSETFGEMMLPKRFHLCESEKSFQLRLSVSGDGDSIALFVKCKGETDLFLDIWVMKEYGVENSWTKLMILTPQGPRRSLHEAVCFRKSGELVLVLEDSRELAALDLVNKQFKLLGVSGGQECYGNSYTESLVLLDRNDAISY